MTLSPASLASSSMLGEKLSSYFVAVRAAPRISVPYFRVNPYRERVRGVDKENPRQELSPTTSSGRVRNAPVAALSVPRSIYTSALNGVKLTPRSKTSAPSLRFRKFTMAYVIGVARTSYTTFAIYPDKIRFTIVQAGSRPANNSTITITVSTA